VGLDSYSLTKWWEPFISPWQLRDFRLLSWESD